MQTDKRGGTAEGTWNPQGQSDEENRLTAMATGSAQPPIFVDLDGTVIATDLLIEGVVLLVTRGSRCVGALPYWLWCGRARLKREVANRAGLDCELLPYRENVLAFLAAQRKLGRRLVLATASDEIWARAVAERLRIFDDVLASDGRRNLKGKDKLDAILEYCRAHNEDQFAYIGDAKGDLPVWDRSCEIYAVAPGPGLRRTLQSTGRLKQIFEGEGARWRAALRVMRPQQWVKNTLIFVPLVLAHQIADLSRLLLGILAFVAFSAGASALYVLNDILDIHADRSHPSKRKRPFANGALPIEWGVACIVVPLAISLSVATLAVSWQFTAVLGLYLVLAMLYSLWLKRKLLVDVFMLAGLYTIRLFAGAVACEVTVTEWLLAFSLFLFTSLAFVKRYAELARLQIEGGTQSPRRGYWVADLPLIENMGVASGYLSVLVLALYIQHPDVSRLYPRRWALWLLCLVILYWISRMWFQARRRILTDDPLVYAIQDWISLLACGAVGVLLLIAATS
jgi:4-hydroxybenzoate polyprenyltransferase